MSKLEIIHGSCADLNVDALVNAASRNLWASGGICGIIFNKADYTELTSACSKIKTPLKDGEAAITPAFNLKNAKYIIHAVGPDFNRTPNAFKELFDAYYSSLELLRSMVFILYLFLQLVLVSLVVDWIILLENRLNNVLWLIISLLMIIRIMILMLSYVLSLVMNIEKQ